jgi:hypothetical protein
MRALLSNVPAARRRCGSRSCPIRLRGPGQLLVKVKALRDHYPDV